MSPILLATASADLERRVQQAVDGQLRSLPFGPLPTDPGPVIDQPVPPKVVVLDAGAEPAAALALAARLDVQCPAISVVLVSEAAAEVSAAAMRAGVRDIVSPSASVADLQQVLDRALASALGRAVALDGATAVPAETPVNRAGRVVTIVSPKGGVGKTTVATNVAVGLARTARSTVLVDLDIQFGDVASALNLEPEYSLTDTVHGPASRDAMVLKTFLTKHETGLYVICGPFTPADADAITGPDVSRLLTMLATEFDYVVVDTAPGLSDPTLAALDRTTDLVLVTSMDVPGVRGLRKELDTLSSLGLTPGSRHVVLNFTDTRTGLSLVDVEATIGTAVDVRLPRSKAVPLSVNQGLPLLQNGVKDPMTALLRSLVNRLAPAPLPKLRSDRASRKAAKVAATQIKPRRAAGLWSRGRSAVAS